jgi:hypothetical protein
MVRIFLSVFVLLAWASVSNAQSVVHFERLEDDLGIITQKEDRVDHVFEFENRGDKDLVIEGLVPS